MCPNFIAFSRPPKNTKRLKKWKKKKVISSCYPKATYGATTTSRLQICIIWSCAWKAPTRNKRDPVMYPKGHLRGRKMWPGHVPERPPTRKKCDLVMLPKRPPTRLRGKKIWPGYVPKRPPTRKKYSFLIYCSTPLWFCSLTQCIDLIYKLTPLFKVQSFIAKS